MIVPLRVQPQNLICFAVKPITRNKARKKPIKRKGTKKKIVKPKKKNVKPKKQAVSRRKAAPKKKPVKQVKNQQPRSQSPALSEAF